MSWLIISLVILMPACVSGGTTASKNAAQSSATKADLAKNPTTESPKQYRYLQLLNREHWLVADLVHVWKTDDAGRSWKQSYNPELEDKVIQYIRGINFINAEVGFLIDRDKLYRTEDSGNTWSEIGPIEAGEDEYDFENCYFVDSLHGWAVGAMQQQDFVRNRKAPYIGAVLATEDGGKTWQRQRLNLPKGYFHEEQRWSLNDVFFFNQQIGWIVGDQVIFWTDNGGKAWHLGHSTDGTLVDYICKDVRFIDNKYGWITMRDSVEILVTNDGGRSWKVLDGPSKFMGTPVEAVFMTREHGFATISDSNLYETRDGGRSWRPRRTGVCEDEGVYTDVGQARDGTLVALCWHSGSVAAIVSTDNGITWHSNDPNKR